MKKSLKGRKLSDDEREVMSDYRVTIIVPIYFAYDSDCTRYDSNCTRF